MKSRKSKRPFRVPSRPSRGSIRVPAERLEPRQLLTGSGNIVVTVTGQLSTATVVYIDANNNGKFDTGDTALAPNQSTYGTYTAASQPFGTYTIRETVPAGYVQAMPTNGAAITYVNNGNSVSANFDNQIGPQLPSLGSISGQLQGAADTTLLLDTNNAGITPHPGERTIQPDSTELHDRECPGRHVQPVGPGRPESEHRQHDRHLSAGHRGGRSVDRRSGLRRRDRRRIGQRTVTGGTDGQIIYLDANNNGQLDPGEFQSTTSGGQFTFPSIPDGSYTVRQVLSGNLSQSTPAGNAGVPITVVDGRHRRPISQTRSRPRPDRLPGPSRAGLPARPFF